MELVHSLQAQYNNRSGCFNTQKEQHTQEGNHMTENRNEGDRVRNKYAEGAKQEKKEENELLEAQNEPDKKTSF